jgi:DNA-directed RNA polymerase specialized sigma24 family protein
VAEHDQDADFAEYVSLRGSWLRKLGYLLSGDWHQADDLAQVTITKLYARWHRLDVRNLDGYVRTTLMNTFL